MNTLLRLCMVAAASVFAASLVVNIVSHLGIRIPGGDAVMMLHLATMAVVAPAFLNSFKNAQTRRPAKADELFKGCPPAMKAGISLLFGYAFLNFLYFMSTNAAHAKPQAHPVPPEVVAGFSGHWMLFSAVAFALMYSALHERARMPGS